MEAHKITGLILILSTLAAMGCSAPYIHQNAILGLSTADMMDSRFEQDALMFTLSVPMKPRPGPSKQAKSLIENEKKEPDGL